MLILKEINCSECGHVVGWARREINEPILCDWCTGSLQEIQETLGKQLYCFVDNEKDNSKRRSTGNHPNKGKAIRWWRKVFTNCMNHRINLLIDK